MRVVAFHANAFEEFTDWAKQDKKLFERVNTLIREARRTPFEGIGKPELLKHKYAGCWSRRINDEHRLVYKVSDDAITIISCKYHYE